MKRRASILLTALAVSGTAAVFPCPSVASAAQATGPATAPATTNPSLPVWTGADGEADLAALGQALLEPANTGPPGRREQAAARLHANGSQEAIRLLLEALRPDAPPPAQHAAAVTVASSARPDPRLVEPLLGLLEAGVPLSLKREVGQALGGYVEDEAVPARLAGIAASPAPTATRQGAVAGLARVPSRASAQALVQLLNGDSPEALEREAADALRAMTGLDFTADDLAAWQAWWDRVGNLDDEAFAAELMRSRTAAAHGEARRAERAFAALLDTARRRHRALPPADRPAVLLEQLSSPVPELREVAATLVLEDANFGEAVAPAVMELVRLAITDPEPRPRALAAQVAQRRTDAASLQPLIAQLGRETSAPAKSAQIRALLSLRDVRALPALLTEIERGSPAIRAEAADAAADLANLAADPVAIARTSAAIRRAFEETDANTRSGRQQRRRLIEALADLSDPSLGDFYVRLLTRGPAPSPVMAATIIRGMGTVGAEALSDTIVDFLGSEDPKVREEAVRALGKTSRGFERAELLFRMLNESVEPVMTVREAAWDALLTMFSRASLTQLAPWEARFSDQPERRLEVLRVLLEKEQQAGNEEQAAFRRQQIGDLLMRENKPGEAVEHYRAALQYSLDHRGAPAAVKTRSQSTLRAYVRARQFEGAIAFAAEAAQRDPGFIEDIGAIVKNEADAFAAAGDPEAARALIDAALRMTPRLGDRIQGQLREQRDRLPPPPTTQ